MLPYLHQINGEWGKIKTLTYGHVEEDNGAFVDKPRFHIHLISVKNEKMGEYSSDDFEKELMSIQPDITYFVGGHTAYPLMQILILRKRHAELKYMKVIAFSMRGHTPTVDFKKDEKGVKKYLNTLGKKLILGPRLKRCNRECDRNFLPLSCRFRGVPEGRLSKTDLYANPGWR